MLREELQLLHEPGSYVGEVIKVMGKSKVLVKVFTIWNFESYFIKITFLLFFIGLFFIQYQTLKLFHNI